MSAGVECDTCRTFTPHPSASWLYLLRPEAQVSIMSALMGPAEHPPAFCSWRCLADYAIARALVEGNPAGAEPPPSGTGWPS